MITKNVGYAQMRMETFYSKQDISKNLHPEHTAPILIIKNFNFTSSYQRIS